MIDRVRAAQDQASKDFIADVGRAISGMSGDVDNVCDIFTERHNRHVAQAVLQLMQHIDTIRQTAAHDERRRMRLESGYPG